MLLKYYILSPLSNDNVYTYNKYANLHETALSFSHDKKIEIIICLSTWNEFISRKSNGI